MTEEIEYQCGRCGSSIAFDECWQCGGSGYYGHDCMEDSCCCEFPDEDEICDICNADGTFPHCLSSPEWCEAHPLPGREKTPRNTPESFTVPTSALSGDSRQEGEKP